MITSDKAQFKHQLGSDDEHLFSYKNGEKWIYSVYAKKTPDGLVSVNNI